MEDISSPATKTDLILVQSELRADIAELREGTKADLLTVKSALKADISELKLALQQMSARMETGFRAAREDTDRVLNVVVNIDRSCGVQLKDHKRRIRKLEKKYGIAVAA